MPLRRDGEATCGRALYRGCGAEKSSEVFSETSSTRGGLYKKARGPREIKEESRPQSRSAVLSCDVVCFGKLGWTLVLRACEVTQVSGSMAMVAVASEPPNRSQVAVRLFMPSPRSRTTCDPRPLLFHRLHPSSLPPSLIPFLATLPPSLPCLLITDIKLRHRLHHV